MRKKRGSLERGLVSSSSSGLWSRGASPNIGGGGALAAAPPPMFALSAGRAARGPPPAPLDPTRDDCLSRLPYASLMAFTMCAVGVFIFTLMTSWSFNASVEQVRRLLNITDIPWLDKVYVFFFVSAAAMAVVTAAFLGVGALSTGSTRHTVYARHSARRGGRALCALSIALSALLNIVWTAVAALAAVLAALYWASTRLCATLPADAGERACLDFSVFRPLVAEFSEATLVLCGGSVQQFCALSSTVVVWYALSCVSALLVCAGLLMFAASAAANHAHIAGESKERQLRDILLAETAGGAAEALGGGPSGGALNSYASGPGGRKTSSSRLMDFQVDAYPALQQPPHAYGGALRNSASQSALPYYREEGLRPGAAAGRRMAQPVPSRTVGRAVNAARRNSYHNSLNEDYNDFPYR